MNSLKKQLKSQQTNITTWNIKDDELHFKALFKKSNQHVNAQLEKAAKRKCKSKFSKWIVSHPGITQCGIGCLYALSCLLCFRLLPEYETLSLLGFLANTLLLFASISLFLYWFKNKFPKTTINRVWKRRASFIYKNHFNPPSLCKHHIRHPQQLTRGLSKAIEYKKQLRKHPAIIIGALILYLNFFEKLFPNQNCIVTEFIKDQLDVLSPTLGLISIFLEIPKFETATISFFILFFFITVSIWLFILVPLTHLELLKQSLDPLLEDHDMRVYKSR